MHGRKMCALTGIDGGTGTDSEVFFALDAFDENIDSLFTFNKCLFII